MNDNNKVAATQDKAAAKDSLTIKLEELLLQPAGGAHCIICDGRINCGDCDVPYGHAADCFVPELLDFYLPAQSHLARIAALEEATKAVCIFCFDGRTPKDHACAAYAIRKLISGGV